STRAVGDCIAPFLVLFSYGVNLSTARPLCRRISQPIDHIIQEHIGNVRRTSRCGLHLVIPYLSTGRVSIVFSLKVPCCRGPQTSAQWVVYSYLADNSNHLKTG